MYFSSSEEVQIFHKGRIWTISCSVFVFYAVDLLELQPLPVKALQDPQLEVLYPFEHFNPIQTQIFHCLYHTDNNMLLGAPTGSGKTIAAEVAMFRVFRKYPGSKVSQNQFIVFGLQVIKLVRPIIMDSSNVQVLRSVEPMSSIVFQECAGYSVMEF
jgi:hypothetical protein